MDRHGVQAQRSASKVTVAGVTFDNNIYDREGDVLYLHVGDPSAATDFDGTAEGDATRYGPDGNLVGITILNAKQRLAEDGKIELTLPEHRVELRSLGDVLS
jgi:uncharacterized protein YuzE